MSRSRLVFLLFGVAACSGGGSAPTGELSSADTTNVCTAAPLGWSDATHACSGVWEYRRFGDCNQRDPSCGPATECVPDWRGCNNYDFGVQDTTYTEAEIGKWVVSPFDHTFSVGQICEDPICDDRGHCSKPHCEADYDAAAQRCDAAAPAHLATVRQAFDSRYRQHVTTAPHQMTLTSNNNGTYRVACTVRIAGPKANFNVGQQCGCAQPLQPPSCPVHEDPRCASAGTTPYFTAATGQTSSSVAAGDPRAATGFFTPKCSSCDGLPLPAVGVSNPSQVQAKYSCLADSAALITQSAARLVVVRDMKLLYELYGADLSDAQRADARSLYESDPSLAPACGADVREPPQPTAACPAAALAGTNGDWYRCQRLADSHVSQALVSREFLGCVALLDRFASLPVAWGADADVACRGPERREQLRPVLTALLEKQMQLMTESSNPLGALGRQLYLVDKWYEATAKALATTANPKPQQLSSDLSEVTGLVWKLQEQKDNIFGGVNDALHSNNPSFDTALAAARTAGQSGRRVDQTIISAAFTPIQTLAPDGITVNRPPMRGVPLVTFLGEALTSLTNRLDTFASMQDFACAFKRCPATATSISWKLIAKLEDEAGLQAALAAAPSSLGEWKTAFDKVRAQHATLRAAMSAAVVVPAPVRPGVSQKFSDVDAGRLAQQALPLARLIGTARTRDTAFVRLGFLDGTGRKELHSGVNEQDRTLLADYIRRRTTALQGTVQTFRTDFVSHINSLISDADGAANLSRTKALFDTKVKQHQQLSDDIAGLRANQQTLDQEMSELTAAVETLRPTLGTDQYFSTGQDTPFDVSGAAAKYDGSANPPLALAVKTMTADPGTIMAVRVSGTYSPSCALQELNVIDPEDGSVGKVGLTKSDGTGVDIGPEGFSLGYSQGSYSAHSATSTNTDSNGHTIGVRAEACISSGPLKEAGVEAKACAYFDAHTSFEHSESTADATGTESRRSAAFSSGLRLRNTPFPDAPAGALLMVVTPSVPNHTSSTVVDVRVMMAPYTSVILPSAAPGEKFDVHFVVNDLGTCTTHATEKQLNVHVTPLLPLTAEATIFTNAAAEVISLFNGQRANRIDQGRLLPSEQASIRSTATQKLQDRLRYPLEQYPPALHNLFNTFLDREIVGLERELEIKAVDRSIELVTIDMDALAHETELAAEHSRLAHRVPDLLLQNLDSERLRQQTDLLLGDTRDYFLPVLELWYPSVIQAIQGNADLDTIRNATVDTDFLTLADAAQRFLNTTLDLYEHAQFGHPRPGEQPPVVALSFRRPTEPAHALPNWLEVHPISGWRQADTARAKQVWDALEARQPATFHIVPEDIYSALGGQEGTLPCKEALPIIRSMALFVLTTSATAGDLNQLERWIGVDASPSMSFATTAGPEVYELNDSTWQSFSMPLLYGSSREAISIFRRAPHFTRPVGLSPFTTFEVPFQALSTIRGVNGIDDGENVGDNAYELVLVMELDSLAVANRLSWVGGCQ